MRAPYNPGRLGKPLEPASSTATASRHAFQNMISGQVSIWEMDGATRMGGGVLSVNPGTSWRTIGA
jgi:hypothetical protein